jgi:uncharacterized protein
MSNQSTARHLNLQEVAGTYGLARLAADASVPDWFNGPGFATLVRASDETTVVCLQDRIPQGVTSDLHWRCFRSLGPIAFDATGIVLSIIAPLSQQGIGVFVVCTYDGEHVLVAQKDWVRSRTAIVAAGHVFVA